MREELLKKLLKELDGIKLTDEELNKLGWLSCWEPDTTECFCNLFRKCRESGPEKRKERLHKPLQGRKHSDN